MTAGRSSAIGLEQPQFAASLRRRGPVGGAELGIDAADVAVDGVHRYRQLAGDLAAGEVHQCVLRRRDLYVYLRLTDFSRLRPLTAPSRLNAPPSARRIRSRSAPGPEAGEQE